MKALHFKALYLEFFFPPKTPYLTLLSHICGCVFNQLSNDVFLFHACAYAFFCCFLCQICACARFVVSCRLVGRRICRLQSCNAHFGECTVRLKKSKARAIHSLKRALTQVIDCQTTAGNNRINGIDLDTQLYMFCENTICVCAL